MRNEFAPLYLLTLLFAANGCGGGPPEKPAPAVTVDHPVEREVTEWDEFAGRLESPEMASVAARVSGFLLEAPFKEGSLLTKGDYLFGIDDRPFKAELASKEADLTRTKAAFTQAQLRYNRYNKIRETKAVTVDDLDQAFATFREAEANMAAAVAAKDLAQLNLEWTRVAAPISGEIGRKLVTVGNLVNGGSGQTTLLTTITSVDPMYAYVNVPERSFLRYRALAAENASAETSGSIPCDFRLEGEDTYRKDCRVDFFDNHVDMNTGTLQLRGVIANDKRELKAGMFVRIRIQGSKPYKALLIADGAVITDQNTRAILVVNKDNVVESRQVKLGPLFGKQRAVVDGLTVDDRVVVQGVQLARPGTKVNPTELQNAAPAAK